MGLVGSRERSRRLYVAPCAYRRGWRWWCWWRRRSPAACGGPEKPPPVVGQDDSRRRACERRRPGLTTAPLMLEPTAEEARALASPRSSARRGSRCRPRRTGSRAIASSRSPERRSEVEEQASIVRPQRRGDARHDGRRRTCSSDAMPWSRAVAIALAVFARALAGARRLGAGRAPAPPALVPRPGSRVLAAVFGVGAWSDAASAGRAERAPLMLAGLAIGARGLRARRRARRCPADVGEHQLEHRRLARDADAQREAVEARAAVDVEPVRRRGRRGRGRASACATARSSRARS